MVRPTLLIAVAALVCSAGWSSNASPVPASPVPPAALPAPACRVGVMHAALLSSAQMCPRPLATTVIARRHHRILRT